MDLAVYDDVKAKAGEGSIMYLKKSNDEIAEHKAEGDKEPRQMFVKLKGLDDDDVVAELQRITAANKPNDKNKTKQDVENERKRSARFLAKITVDGLVFFRGAWVKMNGKADPQVVFDVYNTVGPLRTQAFTFISEVANFTPEGVEI